MKIQNKIKQIFKKLVQPAGFIMVALSTLAFASNADAQAKLDNPIKTASTLADFINVLLGVVKVLGALVTVFFIIYAGFLYVTSGGDVKKIETAHKTLTWVVVGAAIILGASVIQVAITGTVGQLK